MMNKKIMHYLLAAVGVVLMVLGFFNHQIGAAIVGLLVAAVNINSLRKLNKEAENK